MYGGRWNSKGLSVLYTASSLPLAVLEALVHIPQKNFTADFCSLALNIPDVVSQKTIQESLFPDNWRQIPVLPELQEIGNQWILEGKFAVLRVPSVLVPGMYNYLINPLHPEASKIRIQEVKEFVFDERLAPKSY